MKISSQYLDSGQYDVNLEQSTTLDIKSYIYSRFGTFTIVPITADTQSFTSLERYDILLNDNLIGSVSVLGYSGSFNDDVAYAMSSAIDVVTNKISEFLDKEERHLLASLSESVIDSINITEEQKAMYRTFLIENGSLDDVISELNNPTDISEI